MYDPAVLMSTDRSMLANNRTGMRDTSAVDRAFQASFGCMSVVNFDYASYLAHMSYTCKIYFHKGTMLSWLTHCTTHKRLYGVTLLVDRGLQKAVETAACTSVYLW